MKAKIESIIKEATELKDKGGPTASRYSFVVVHLESALYMVGEIEKQNKISEIRNPTRVFADTPAPLIESTPAFKETQRKKIQEIMKEKPVEKNNEEQIKRHLPLNHNKPKNNKP